MEGKIHDHKEKKNETPKILCVCRISLEMSKKMSMQNANNPFNNVVKVQNNTTKSMSTVDWDVCKVLRHFTWAIWYDSIEFLPSWPMPKPPDGMSIIRKNFVCSP